jgi:hypothetical protein
VSHAARHGMPSHPAHAATCPGNYCCRRTQPVADTCPTCPGSSVHKLEAYPQESDLPSLSDHRSVDGKLSCGSDTSPGNHVATPRSERRTGDLNQN